MFLLKTYNDGSPASAGDQVAYAFATLIAVLISVAILVAIIILIV